MKMRNYMITVWFYGVMVCLAVATPFATLDCSTSGDGWYEYSLTLHNDPFFVGVSANPSMMSGTYFEHGTIPYGWSGSTNFPYCSWKWLSDDQYMPRPTTTTFRVRSESTNWVIASQGMILIGDIMWYDELGSIVSNIMSANIVYLQKMPALVPCESNDVQSGEGKYTYQCEMVPNPRIDKLVVEDEQIVGLDFSWPHGTATNYTVRISGSMDQKVWTNIAYAYGFAGTNRWIPENCLLEDYARFFRLQLISLSHLDPLPELNTITMDVVSCKRDTSKSAALNISVKMVLPDQLEVTLDTQIGGAYIIECQDVDGAVMLEKRFRATGVTTSIMFKASELPSLSMFQARAL